ncbi:MAG: NAD(P)-dependent oxidoreductase [Actinomycetota bacterium]|nr:NAD(P)-dependent oxidoreductase [Actinomycetota bacterium]
MSRLIVLGAGFLGTAVAHAGSARTPTTVIDPPFDATLQHRDAAATAALRTVVAAEQALDGDVAVINACGRISGTREELHDANVDFVQWLVDALDGTGARLVHVGSASEIGDPGTASPVDESRAAAPVGDYAETKAEATAVVRSAAGSGLHAVVARVFNVVGPTVPAGSPLSGWLSEIQALPDDGGTVEVWWPDTTRDFVHVDDVAGSLIDLASVDPASVDTAVVDTASGPSLVNVCTGTGLRFGDIVSALADALGRTVQVRSLDRPGIECVVGDPSLLVELTGAAPTMTLERLASTVARGMVAGAG